MLKARLLFTALATATALTAAQAHGPGEPSLQDRRQAACYNDVQRLCGKFIPDVGKTTSCMEPRKHQVSAKCRALWDVKS